MILAGAPDRGLVARFDPRARLVFALAIAVCVLALQSFVSLCVALAVAFLLAFAAYGGRIPWRRFLLLNAIMLGLAIMLPWSLDGGALFSLGALDYTEEGLLAVLRIALRANAIVLALTALVGTLDPVKLGHALAHLRCPRKFAQLLLLTVRYIDVLEAQYHQLRVAMRVRCFEPRLNRHTLHAFGNLVGMLLVRAVERSEAVHDAMRCRAFNGVYPIIDDFRWTRRDTLASAALCIVFGALFVVDITGGLP